LTLLDITLHRRHPERPPHLPKAEEFPDYLFVVVNPLSPRYLCTLQAAPDGREGGRPRALTQLSGGLTHAVLVTHHDEPLPSAEPSVERVHAFLGKHPEQGGRGPDYLFHLLLDHLVDEFAPVLDHVSDALEEIEEQVFARPAQGLLERLIRLKRSTIVLRKSLVHSR